MMYVWIFDDDQFEKAEKISPSAYYCDAIKNLRIFTVMTAGTTTGHELECHVLIHTFHILDLLVL